MKNRESTSSPDITFEKLQILSVLIGEIFMCI